MKRLVLASILTFIFLNPAYLLALPKLSSIESGQVSLDNPDSSTLNIKASDKSVINFSSFDILRGETV
ncbi:MAG: hypothetical protein JW734_01005, partial [Candidatus Omnitrophica bacterium]|nr:hypothetical protein [Candidatus Omnitrophota bacterium]